MLSLGDLGAGLLLGEPGELGERVPLLAERDRERDGAPVEDLRPGARVGVAITTPAGTDSEYAGSPTSASRPAASSLSTAAASSGLTTPGTFT